MLSFIVKSLFALFKYTYRDLLLIKFFITRLSLLLRFCDIDGMISHLMAFKSEMVVPIMQIK